MSGIFLALLVGCSEPEPPAPSQDGGQSATGGHGGAANTGPRNGAAGLALRDAGGASKAEAGTEPDPPDSAGRPALPADGAYVTTHDLSRHLDATSIYRGDGPAGAKISIDPSTTFQTMIGFGASITDSSSYVMTRYLSAEALHQVLVRLFDPTDGIGLSFLRQPMGASDFSSVGNFSYDDGTSDPTLSRFDLGQDMKATVPVLRQALAINPDVFIMATPWSPPGWMKLNGSMNGSGNGGGNSGLAGAAYDLLARYFVKFVQAYGAQGIAVSAVTPQNEPQNGAASYPGMDLDAASETTLIAKGIGPAFKAAGLSTFVWAFDHNWDHEDYPEQVVSDVVAGGFAEGAAFHCYGGTAAAMGAFHAKFPNKGVYMTECSGGDWQNDAFADTVELAIDSTSNFARAISLWNMALDERHGPTNHGCDTCRGVVTINSASSAVTYEVDYYALGHFSKFVKRGAMRIGSTSSNGALHQVAFRNTDGRLAVVAHNTSSQALRVQVGDGNGALRADVPAGAAATFAFTP